MDFREKLSTVCEDFWFLFYFDLLPGIWPVQCSVVAFEPSGNTSFSALTWIASSFGRKRTFGSRRDLSTSLILSTSGARIGAASLGVGRPRERGEMVPLVKFFVVAC